MNIEQRWKPQPFHEIYNLDCYRLKQLTFQPDTFYDIGGNLGCFVGYAKTLFPNSKVVSIEPHPTNFAFMEQCVGGLPGVTLLNRALGAGPVYWIPAIGGESNPGGHTYISESVGYNHEDVGNLTPAKCESVTLWDLYNEFPPSGPYVVKLDCEGGEECLFGDDASNDVLHGAAYFAAELHFFAAKHREIPEVDRLKPGLLGTHGHVIREFMDWMYGFSDTHKVEIELCPNSAMMWATKK
jgi:FkbM family methyltransferase